MSTEKTKTSWLSAVLVVMALSTLGACNCNGGGGGDGGPDGGPDGGGCVQNGGGCGVNSDCCNNSCSARGVCETTVNPDGGPGQCTALGGACVSSVECCNGACLQGSDGGYVCSPGTTCAPNGSSCALAGDCCSRSCVGGQCATGSLCKINGTACDTADPATCCTGVCTGSQCVQPPGSSCKVAGDRCTAVGFDSSCCSRVCVDYDPTAAGQDLRCGFVGVCRSEGEPCKKNTDCCSYTCGTNGVCQRPTTGGQCLVAGSACQSISDCCSGICGIDSRGFRTCQFLGGCRPEEELCRSHQECCSFASPNAPPQCIFYSDAGIGRCKVYSGDAPAGEICEGSRGNTCSPNMSFCVDDNSGILRCGSACDGGVCGGGNCLPTGSTCAGANDCCSRICVPTDLGYRCANACLGPGGQCSANGDCCSGLCGATGICEVVDGGTCRTTGSSCTQNSDCCELNCNGGVCRTGTCPGQGGSCSTTQPCCAGLTCVDPNAQLCTTGATCSCQVVIN